MIELAVRARLRSGAQLRSRPGGNGADDLDEGREGLTLTDLGDFLSLSYGEVKRSVQALPDEAIAELAQGPLPDLKPGDEGYTKADDCRVCRALGDPDEGTPAAALLEWHDFVSKSFDMVRKIAGVKTWRDGELRTLTEECQAMIGGLSYARCTTIYALAEAEAGVRRRRLEAVRG
jgi:hypothetical protein